MAEAGEGNPEVVVGAMSEDEEDENNYPAEGSALIISNEDVYKLIAVMIEHFERTSWERFDRLMPLFMSVLQQYKELKIAPMAAYKVLYSIHCELMK